MKQRRKRTNKQVHVNIQQTKEQFGTFQTQPTRILHVAKNVHPRPEK